ncbi:MAG: hypothetical protein V5A48_12265, partial [Salinivenus sp.]
MIPAHDHVEDLQAPHLVGVLPRPPVVDGPVEKRNRPLRGEGNVALVIVSTPVVQEWRRRWSPFRGAPVPVELHAYTGWEARSEGRALPVLLSE